MPRDYRNIKEYEKEIMEMKSNRMTNQEIGEKAGFTIKQLPNFITRYNANQKKLEAVINLRKKEDQLRIVTHLNR